MCWAWAEKILSKREGVAGARYDDAPVAGECATELYFSFDFVCAPNTSERPICPHAYASLVWRNHLRADD